VRLEEICLYFPVGICLYQFFYEQQFLSESSSLAVFCLRFDADYFIDLKSAEPRLSSTDLQHVALLQRCLRFLPSQYSSLLSNVRNRFGIFSCPGQFRSGVVPSSLSLRHLSQKSKHEQAKHQGISTAVGALSWFQRTKKPRWTRHNTRTDCAWNGAQGVFLLDSRS